MIYNPAKMPDLSSINRGLRVLVVEDDEVYADILRSLLDDDKRIASIQLAKNGQDAIEALRSEAWPDLVLSDLSMPRLDGFEFLLRLRQEERRRKEQEPEVFQAPAEDEWEPVTPAVALTSSDTAIDFSKVLESGGTSFATKPRNVADLRILMRSIVRAVIWSEPLPLVISVDAIREKRNEAEAAKTVI